MKLKALDQFHLSAVKTDSLRPGEEFEVGDDLGAQLLAKHPSVFSRIAAPPAAKPPAARKAKAAPARKTKVQRATLNKSAD